MSALQPSKEMLCRQYELCTPLEYQCIQSFLEALYLHTRLNPEHLLLAPKDHAALVDHVIEGTNVRTSTAMLWTSVPSVTRIANETTGKLISIASLPGLKEGSVIVGFFS